MIFIYRKTKRKLKNYLNKRFTEKMSLGIAFHGTLLREYFQTLPIERYSKTWLERREGGRSIESWKDSAGHLVSRKACFSFPQGARLPRKACIFHAQRERKRDSHPFGIFIRPLYFQLTFPKLLNRVARHRHQRFCARSFPFHPSFHASLFRSKVSALPSV